MYSEGSDKESHQSSVDCELTHCHDNTNDAVNPEVAKHVRDKDPDIIYGTAYSKRWLLTILVQIAELAKLKRVDEPLLTQTDSAALEQDLCELWDATITDAVNAIVVEYDCHHFMEMIVVRLVSLLNDHTISDASSIQDDMGLMTKMYTRIVELMVGILANVAIWWDASKKPILQPSAGIVASDYNFDPLCTYCGIIDCVLDGAVLRELFRLVHVLLSKLDDVSKPQLEAVKYLANTNLVFVLQNSLYSPLICSAINMAQVLVCHFSEHLLGSEFGLICIGALCEAVKTLSSEQCWSIDDQVEHCREVAVGVVIDILASSPRLHQPPFDDDTLLKHLRLLLLDEKLTEANVRLLRYLDEEQPELYTELITANRL